MAGTLGAPRWEKELREAMLGDYASQVTNYSRPVVSDTIGARGRQMIAMRLHLGEGNAMPFNFLETVQMKNRMVIFIAHNDQAIQLEDSLDLFPSDTLITQLRLIMGQKAA